MLINDVIYFLNAVLFFSHLYFVALHESEHPPVWKSWMLKRNESLSNCVIFKHEADELNCIFDFVVLCLHPPLRFFSSSSSFAVEVTIWDFMPL